MKNQSFLFLAIIFFTSCNNSLDKIDKPSITEVMELMRQSNLNDTVFETLPRKIFSYSEGGTLTISVPTEESQKQENLLNACNAKGLFVIENTSEFVATPGDLFTGRTEYYKNLIPTEKGKSYLLDSYNSKKWTFLLGEITFDTISNVILKKEGEKNIFYVNYTINLHKNEFYDIFYPNGQTHKYYYAIISKENNKWQVIDNGFALKHGILAIQNNLFDTTVQYKIPTYRSVVKWYTEFDYSSSYDGFTFNRPLNIVVHKNIPYFNFELKKMDSNGNKIIKYAAAEVRKNFSGGASWGAELPITENHGLNW